MRTLSELREARDRVCRTRFTEMAENALAAAGDDRNPTSLIHSAQGAIIAGEHELAMSLLGRAEARANTVMVGIGRWAREDEEMSVPVLTTSRANLERNTRRELMEIRRMMLAVSDGVQIDEVTEQARVAHERTISNRLLDLVGVELAELLGERRLEEARVLALEVFEDELQDPVRAEEVRATSPSDLEPLARLVRAQAALGEISGLDVLPRIGRTGTEVIARRADSRATGDAAEAFATPTRRRWKVEELTSVEAWRRTARGMLTWPLAFAAGKDLSGPRPDTLAAWITVGPGVMRELLGECEQDPGHLETVVLSRPHGTREGVLSLWVTVVYGARVDGRDLRMAAMLPAGATRSETDSGCVRAARRVLSGIGMRADVEAVREWDGAQLSEEPPSSPLPVLAASALFGTDRCTHEKARWVLNDPCDAMVLQCSSCLRRRVAVVPRHRLPEDHPEHPLRSASHAKRDAYLRRERFYRELAGDARPAGSIEQLCAEPSLSLEPSDYAVRVLPPARPAGLAGVLGARRR